MPRRKSKRRLGDQSTCPKCHGDTSIMHAGKTLYGDDRFMCHQCDRHFDVYGREIPEEEMKLIRVKVKEDWEKFKKNNPDHPLSKE